MAVQKKMNLMQLTFIVAVNMMGSGIIMLPTNMAQVGAISLLSWIVTAVGSMAIAYGFAQAGMYNQRPGGMAAYAQDAYGKPGYFQVFLLYFLSLAIGNVAIGISAVGYLATFFPRNVGDADHDLHQRDRTPVAHHGRQFRRTERDRKDRLDYCVGSPHTGRCSFADRMVLVQQGHLRGSLESAGPEHRAGHGLEHFAHVVGVPRHGIRRTELRLQSRIRNATCRSPAFSARSARRSSTCCRRP